MQYISRTAHLDVRWGGGNLLSFNKLQNHFRSQSQILVICDWDFICPKVFVPVRKSFI